MLPDKDYLNAIGIERFSIILHGYVGRFVGLLKNRHKNLLAVVNTKPEFLFTDHGTLQSCTVQAGNTPPLTQDRRRSSTRLKAIDERTLAISQSPVFPAGKL